MGGKRAHIGLRMARLTVTLAVLASILIALESPASADQTISSTGPLTSIRITPDLNCDVRHAADVQPEFFNQTACATIVATGGNRYSPAVIPAGMRATGTPFTPLSQASSGTGTAADPYRIVTVVRLGDSGLRLTQTDSYVVGQESYRTAVQLDNLTNTPKSAIVYRAGDCYLQNDDWGYGLVGPAPGAVACRRLDTNRVEQFLPITPGSHYMEAAYHEVWDWIAKNPAEPFPDTCRCDERIDNGAGLSWTVTVPATGSTTVSSLITFSPTGVLPLSTTATADAATVSANAANGYTVRIANPNPQVVPLTTVTATLPPGFTYTPGSTTGMTTANPTVNGRTLTWTGPFNVAASGSATLHFNVTAASVPGTYFVEADGEAGAFSVAPTGPTAPVTVSGPPPCTTTLSGNRVGPFTVRSGQHLCLSNGRFAGRVTVTTGGALTVTNAQLAGGVVASGASWIRLCGSSVSTGLTVAGSPGPIRIGDPTDGCAGNRVAGTGVGLTDNTGTIVLAGNSVAGGIRCSGNATAPGNGRQRNTLIGPATATGQCAGI